MYSLIFYHTSSNRESSYHLLQGYPWGIPLCVLLTTDFLSLSGRGSLISPSSGSGPPWCSPTIRSLRMVLFNSIGEQPFSLYHHIYEAAVLAVMHWSSLKRWYTQKKNKEAKNLWVFQAGIVFKLYKLTKDFYQWVLAVITRELQQRQWNKWFKLV